MVVGIEQPEGRVVVGVTGHRTLAHEETLLASIDLVLHQIARAFRASSLTIISPLARGADQLVARRALARPRSRLIVPLPLPLEVYLEDFSAATRESFLELWDQAVERFVLPAAASRDEAYEAAGLYVVEHSDVLIAVWDGQPARGRGGTASIVARTRACGLPMAWIGAGNGVPDTVPSPATDEHRRTVTFERFPSPIFPVTR